MVKRWLCAGKVDPVCVQGGCGFCNPFNCACGKRHTGSRQVTEPQMVRMVMADDKVREALGRNWRDEVSNGMSRQQVTDRDRKHLTDYVIPGRHY